MDLHAQLRMFRRSRPVSSMDEAATALREMVPEVRAEYDQVGQLVKLLMVSPASSAQAERSFSALRRLKTWLRTSVSETQLNSVAVCHTHQRLLHSLDIKSIMSAFVSHSDLRASLFGRVRVDVDVDVVDLRAQADASMPASNNNVNYTI